MVYGHGSDPIPVAVVAREFQVALSGEAGLNTLLSLEVGGDNFLTLARDIQHHPFRNVVTHVDFQIVRRDEVISAEIPINLVGEAVEVHHGDGIVDQQLFTLQIKAKPADIPPSVDLDISELTIGASLHVSDLTIPAGVELETDVEITVVAGQPPRVQTTDDAEAEAAAEAAGGSSRRRRRGRRRRFGRRRVLGGLGPAPQTGSPGRRATRHPGRPAGGGPGQPGHRVCRHPAQRRCRGGGGAGRASRRPAASREGPARPMAEVRIGGRRVLLAVPTTFMNESGQAVAPLVRRAGIDQDRRRRAGDRSG